MKHVVSISMLFLVGLFLAGCAGQSPTFLQPYSLIAADESNLYTIILVMAAVVFLLVESLLVYNIVRFRRRSDSKGEPRQIYGNWRLEFVWSAGPVLLVLILFVFTVTTMNAIAAPEQTAKSDVNVHIIGHQWWWEFDYPDLNIKTANELHVPVGAAIRLNLNSADVIHSFWVPQLSHKIDVIPGQTNTLWFRADQVGVYDGHCAEFCGANHANMRIRVVVETADQFAAWVKNQQEPPVQPVTDQEKEGQLIITQGACNSCHTLGDAEAVSPIAPDLTHLMSRAVFGGASFDLNEANLRRWLEDRQDMKPGNDMIVALTKDQIDALMAYLMKLK
jgi:cytochrome c oxidase subunit II